MFGCIVDRQRECDDPYYPPYQDALAVFKDERAAITQAEAYAAEHQKFMSDNDCFYVLEHSFSDEGRGSKRNVFLIDKDGKSK